MKLINRFKRITILWTKWSKPIYWIIGIGAIASMILMLYANSCIERSTKPYIYSNVHDVPYNSVGLLLGTNKLLRSGKPNQYFAYRIAATVELYKAGKVSNIVISGDNSTKGYNEPQDMKEALLAAGIPCERIYLDFAGFRTFDSVVRMNKIFGQSSFTIISQQFHNQRAIYIAKFFGLNASGYSAKDVDAYNGFKTQLREKFARVKVMLDLYFGKEPKFLGERIPIR
ncbi:SanA protein [Williamwhitmania taraxaci]|uniref:SanA protein n=2 Tax=Williamwhitmania taraxaci TaxID=1640674 RepID=A0A1G6K0D7_9BACT|nr:SanA protein [Williamwhitmania taraxaci]